MMGELSCEAIARFWRHAKSVEAWKHHSLLHGLGDAELTHLMPCALHADGAEMFTDDEYFIYSWSSAFSTSSLTTDVLLNRFPIAVIAEREMFDDNVIWFLCFMCMFCVDVYT